MPRLRAALLLLLIAGIVPAQDPGEEEGGETEITVAEEQAGPGKIEIRVDPFAPEREDPAEPNRPEPIKVGEWRPAEGSMDAAARAELDRLLQERGVRPDDVALRYRLAEHYFRHGWWPHAEAEFRRSAELDPESIRPWEGLLRVYRSGMPEPGRMRGTIVIFAGGRVIRQNEDRDAVRDWLPSVHERNRRITNTYLELIRRRPEDFARRRELLAHLKKVGDDRRLAEQARAILARLPGDVVTRFELADAARRLGERKDPEEQGLGTPEWEEARRLLEANAERAPDHVPSALRLARMLALEKGDEAKERILELERRAFFRLFVRTDLASVPYSEDIMRMAQSLSGKGIGTDLWDAAMRPPAEEQPEEVIWPRPEPDRYYERWIFLAFPHSTPRERSRVIASLGRRGDEAVVAVLLSFLWHLPGEQDPGAEREIDRTTTVLPQEEAIAAATKLGTICYPAAERYLRAADTPLRRRRGVRVLRGLRDPRAVLPLLEALAYDIDEKLGYGVAPALEELGDPRAIDGLVDAALDVRRPADRRREAAEALALFRDPRAVEALSRLAKEMEFRLVTAYGLYRLTGDKKAFAAMERIMLEERRTEEVLRLAAKFEDARLEGLLLEALRRSPEDDQLRIVDMLKERYWATAAKKVLAFYLEQQRLSDFGIRLLGEMGGEEAIQRLLGLVEQRKGESWTIAARALAETGDDRAVRYFARTKILERDDSKRRQARAFHEIALRRRAERLRPGPDEE